MVVGELNVRRTLGHEKRHAQSLNRRHLAAEDKVTVLRRHLLAPRTVPEALLVNGDALAEPARHAVVSFLQCDDVAVLMPEERLPVLLKPDKGFGAVCRDHLAKAHAHVTVPPGDAKRPDGEVLFLRENFHDHRILDLGVVFFGKQIARLGQQIDRFVAVQRRLLGSHPQQKAIALDRHIVLQRVIQRQQVVCRDVVAVGLVRLFGQLPAFLVLPKPQEVLRQLGLRDHVILVKTQGKALMKRPLLEQVFGRKFFANLMIHQRVGFPEFQATLPSRLGLLGFVLDGMNGGLQRPTFRVMWIDLEDRLEDAVGSFVLLGVRLIVRLQQQ